MRMVSTDEWDLSQLHDPARQQRLLDPPSARNLLTSLLDEEAQAARNGQIQLDWQQADEASGYFRLVAQIPIKECTFDQLFNGRSGYRAQYYLSPEEGILYNRQVLDESFPAIRTAYEYEQTRLKVSFDLIKCSLLAPHAKIWVFQEKEAFDEAAENILNPPRWVENGATRGRRIPLPSHCKIDLKGAFIQPNTGALFVDPLKLDRPCDLHRKGYT